MTTPSNTSMERPKEAAKRLYSDEFLAQLGARFGFDALEPGLALELRRLARSYLSARRQQGTGDKARASQSKYRALRQATLKFIAVIENAEDEEDIADEMYLAAHRLGAENDKFGITKLAEGQSDDKEERHYRYLLGLLNLLAAAAKGEADSYKLPSGPRKDAALESLTQYASFFWSHHLGRKFTVDYHRGSGLTESFQFVRALLEPFEDKVTDQQIVTAMRAEIKSRNARQKRPRAVS